MCVRIEHVCAVALYVGSAPCHLYSQMVLRYNLHRKVVFLNLDVRVAPHGLDESALDFGAGVVGMMQYAELRMPSLAVQVELAVFFPVLFFD